MHSTQTTLPSDNTQVIKFFSQFVPTFVQTQKNPNPATKEFLLKKQVFTNHLINEDKTATPHAKLILRSLICYLTYFTLGDEYLLNSSVQLVYQLCKLRTKYDDYPANTACENHFIYLLCIIIDVSLEAHNKHGNGDPLILLKNIRDELSLFLQNRKDDQRKFVIYAKFLFVKLHYLHLATEYPESSKELKELRHRNTFEKRANIFIKSITDKPITELTPEEEALQYILIIYQMNVTRHNLFRTTAFTEDDAQKLFTGQLDELFANGEFIDFLNRRRNYKDKKSVMLFPEMTKDFCIFTDLSKEIFTVFYHIMENLKKLLQKINVDNVKDDPSHKQWFTLFNIISYKINALEYQRTLLSFIELLSTKPDVTEFDDDLANAKKTLVAMQAAQQAAATKPTTPNTTQETPAIKKSSADKRKKSAHKKKKIKKSHSVSKQDTLPNTQSTITSSNTNDNNSPVDLVEPTNQEQTTSPTPDPKIETEIRVQTTSSTTQTMNHIVETEETPIPSIPYTMEVPAYVERALQTLYEHNHAAYIVGGAIRDQLLSKVASDFDVATSAGMSELTDLFKGFRHKIIGGTYPIFQIETGSRCIQISPLISLSDRSNPETFTSESGSIHTIFRTTSLVEDAAHRDITFNSLYYDARTKRLYNPVNGFAHLLAKKIEFNADAKILLSKNPLLILRALRFIGAYNLNIAEDDKTIMCAESHRLTSINWRRLEVEFKKIFNAVSYTQALLLLQTFNVPEALYRNTALLYMPNENIASMSRQFNMPALTCVTSSNNFFGQPHNNLGLAHTDRSNDCVP